MTDLDHDRRWLNLGVIGALVFGMAPLPDQRSVPFGASQRVGWPVIAAMRS
jgi:hypothetical protein